MQNPAVQPNFPTPVKGSARAQNEHIHEHILGCTKSRIKHAEVTRTAALQHGAASRAAHGR